MSIICKVMRGEFLESLHTVYAVVVNEAGDLVYSAGDPEFVTCVRSSLKPFQAAASVKAGAVDSAEFTEAELALMCASHNGEETHVKTVQSMITKLDYSLAYYECGSHLPYDRQSRVALIRDYKDPVPYHNNCSGKHAGMLCLAKHLGVDPNGYTKPDHPVQKAIFDLIKRYTGLNTIPVSVDGCSAPTPFLKLRTIALLFQKLASGKYPELKRIYQAMTKHPYLIGGEGRFDTNFIAAMSGRAVTKVGGEAIRGMGIRTPDRGTLGIALKVLDGSQRCMPVATMTLLTHLDLLTEIESDKLQSYQKKKLKNHRQIIIGAITAKIENSP